jgi:hypothetical protein
VESGRKRLKIMGVRCLQGIAVVSEPLPENQDPVSYTQSLGCGGLNLGLKGTVDVDQGMFHVFVTHVDHMASFAVMRPSISCVLTRGNIPSIVRDLSPDPPGGLLRDSIQENIFLLWPAHHVEPHLLVHIGIRLGPQVGCARGRRVSVVEEPWTPWANNNYFIKLPALILLKCTGGYQW